MIKVVLIIVIMLLSIPIGLLIAWFARDELISGRKWFIALIVLSVIAAFLCLFFSLYTETLSLLFITIVSAISLWKSKDKSWTKRRI